MSDELPDEWVDVDLPDHAPLPGDGVESYILGNDEERLVIKPVGGDESEAVTGEPVPVEQ